MKEPFYKDYQAISDFDKNVETGRKRLQIAVDAYNRASFKPLESIEHLQRFYTTDTSRRLIEDVLKDAVHASYIPEDAPTQINGIPVKREKILELLELPPLDQVTAEMKVISQHNGGPYLRDAFYWSVYRLDGDQVTINQQAANEIIARDFCAFAETKDEEERLEAAGFVCKALNHLVAGNPGLNPEALQISGLVLWQSGKFAPAPGFVKYGIIQNQIPIINFQTITAK